MSDERHYSSLRTKSSGFLNVNKFQHSRYEDRSSKDNFPERRFEESRNAAVKYPKIYNREEYKHREYERNSREDDRFRPFENRRVTHDNFNGNGRNFEKNGHSPRYYPKQIHTRPISPVRKEYYTRDLGTRIRAIEVGNNNFDIYKNNNRRDFSPVIRESQMPSSRYDIIRYEGNIRQHGLDHNSFNDRRRGDFQESTHKDSREYRSRSPNIRPRSGKFNSQSRGYRTEDFNHFEQNHRGNFNRIIRESPIGARLGAKRTLGHSIGGISKDDYIVISSSPESR